MAADRHPVDVSIIVPTRDRRDRVLKALESLLGQAGDARVEILCVDDGSTDGTARAVESRFGEEVRLLRRTKSAGPAAARNEGLRAARGRWIGFLDSDDRAPAGAVCRRLRSLEEEGADAVYGRTEVRTETGEAGRLSPRGRAPSGRIFEALIRGGSIYLGTVFVARSVVEEVGLFREELTHEEDQEWLWRVAAVSRFAFVDAVVCHRLRHGDSLRRDLRGYLEQGTEATDALFNWEGLPDEHRDLEPVARAQAELRLARAAWKLNEPDEFRTHFRRAIGHDRSTALNPRFIRRWLQALLPF